MSITISRLTREFIRWDVSSDANLSIATVEIAFMDDPTKIPDEADWNSGELVDVETSQSIIKVARILVGPDHVDSVDLTPPTQDLIDYQSWVRITDEPERPVRKSGIVTVE